MRQYTNATRERKPQHCSKKLFKPKQCIPSIYNLSQHVGLRYHQYPRFCSIVYAKEDERRLGRRRLVEAGTWKGRSRDERTDSVRGQVTTAAAALAMTCGVP